MVNRLIQSNIVRDAASDSEASSYLGNTSNMELLESTYRAWILQHKEMRDLHSERRRRLTDRDDHSERLFAINIWLPVVGNFEYLHPEYEVNDYRDGSRFLDFAYIRTPYRISIEIDGYGGHQRNASRRVLEMIVLDKTNSCLMSGKLYASRMMTFASGHDNANSSFSSYLANYMVSG